MRNPILALLLLLAAIGAARAQATAPGGPDPMVCVYNTTSPVLNPGQTGYVQCDAAGKIIISNPGSGGGGGGAVYGPDAVGSVSTKPPVQTGYVDASGNVQKVAPATPMPTADQNVAPTISSPGTASTKAQGAQRADGTPIAGDGADNAGVSQPNGGSGIRGWLSAIYSKIAGTLSTTDTNAAQTITAPGTAPAKAQGVQAGDGTPVARDGTDGTGISQPTGGVGIRGWLSGIYKAVTGTVTVDLAYLRNSPGSAQGFAANVQGAAANGFGVGGAVTTQAGGINLFSRIPSSAATTNATSAKTSAGRVYKIVACNTTTTPARIKFYNTASAPTPGTTTVLFTRPIPAAAAAGGLACASYDAADIGWSFSTGIAYALTTGAADSDTTAVAAGAITDLSVEYQ